MLYFDHAATTPLAPGVLDAMLPYLGEHTGNPSSMHAAGRHARSAVDAARDTLAGALGAQQREIVFTAGGTEADNLALRGVLERHGDERGRHLVVSAIEHDAVLQTARRLADTGAASLSVVPCTGEGVVTPDDVAARVRPDTVCVSVMLVNNETGVTQDVAAIAAAVRARNPATLVHTDAVQALARMDVRPAALGADLASFSAHKLGGPKGTGALWVRDGVAVAAQLTGGGQERNRRSGTENVAGIAGFAAAVERATRRRGAERERQVRLTRRLESALLAQAEGAVVAAAAAPRAPGIVLLLIPGVRSDVLVTALDRMGLCASAGSACSSGAPVASHVLAAMGTPPELAAGAVRLSLGEPTSEAEVDEAAAVVAAAVRQVRDVTLSPMAMATASSPVAGRGRP